MEHGLSGACHQCFALPRQGAGLHAVAISVAAGLGAHQPDRRLPLAQQCQGRCGQVQAVATAATDLACFIFRFLRRPLFGTAGMFLYPMFYHLGTTLLPIFKNQNSYGVYVGSTIHEVAQVFAAGQAIGPKAADTAVIVKMIRVMMLAPFLLILSGWLRFNSVKGSAQSRKITIPWFAVFFIVMAGINSLQWLPSTLTQSLIVLDNFLLAMAMAALGLTTHLGGVRAAGLKPLMLGGILFTYLIFGGGCINWLVAIF